MSESTTEAIANRVASQNHQSQRAERERHSDFKAAVDECQSANYAVQRIIFSSHSSRVKISRVERVFVADRLRFRFAEI